MVLRAGLLRWVALATATSGTIGRRVAGTSPRRAAGRGTAGRGASGHLTRAWLGWPGPVLLATARVGHLVLLDGKHRRHRSYFLALVEGHYPDAGGITALAGYLTSC